MKIEDQVCSLELAKRLKELGVKQESVQIWAEMELGNTPEDAYSKFIVMDYGCETDGDDFYSAFTVAELGEMLPMEANSYGLEYFKDSDNQWRIYYHGTFGVIDDSEADARAKMLIHLIEKGIVKP